MAGLLVAPVGGSAQSATVDCTGRPFILFFNHLEMIFRVDRDERKMSE